MDMHNVEELELPQLGMNVEDGDKHCQYYFANAENLKKNNYMERYCRRRYNRLCGSSLAE